MSVRYISVGAGAAGAASCVPALPAGPAAGDLMVCAVSTNHLTDTAAEPTMPAGWTKIGSFSGNGGTQGISTGPRRCTMFYREWQSGDAAPTVTFTGGDAVLARIALWRKSRATWVLPPPFGTGADTDITAPVTCQLSVDLGLQTGDIVTGMLTRPSGVSDSTTPERFAATGVTFGAGDATAGTTALMHGTNFSTQGNDVTTVWGWDRVQQAAATTDLKFETGSTAGDRSASGMIIRLRDTGTDNEVGPRYLGISGYGAGTTTMGVPWLGNAASAAPGDLAVLAIGSNDAINSTQNIPQITDAGWNYRGSVQGGGGVQGVGTGDRRLTYYTRELNGTEDPLVTVTLTNGDILYGLCLFYAKNMQTEAWDQVIAAAFGVDTTSDTTFSATTTTNPPLSGEGIAPMHLVLTYVLPGSTQGFSAEAITATGVTFGTTTERDDRGTLNGNDLRYTVATSTATVGVSSAAPVITATLTAAGVGVAGVLPVSVFAATAAAATGSLSLSGTAIANPPVAAAANGELAFSHFAVGAQGVAGASGALSLSGTGTAVAAPVPASGTGALSLSGTAAAQAVAAASGALSLSGSAGARATATASGTLTLSGTASARATVSATGVLTLSGSATARAPTTGSGSLTLSGTSGAQASATASGSLTLSGTGTVEVGSTPASATGALTLSGTAAARATVSATGILSLSGTGGVSARALATGALSLSGTSVAAAPSSATGSLSLSGTATAKPSAPTGVTATAVSVSQINLTWDAFPDATGYDIERNGSVILINHLTTAYSDTGLTGNVQYNYRVRAVL